MNCSKVNATQLAPTPWQDFSGTNSMQRIFHENTVLGPQHFAREFLGNRAAIRTLVRMKSLTGQVTADKAVF